MYATVHGAYRGILLGLEVGLLMCLARHGRCCFAGNLKRFRTGFWSLVALGSQVRRPSLYHAGGITALCGGGSSSSGTEIKRESLAYFYPGTTLQIYHGGFGLGSFLDDVL